MMLNWQYINGVWQVYNDKGICEGRIEPLAGHLFATTGGFWSESGDDVDHLKQATEACIVRSERWAIYQAAMKKRRGKAHYRRQRLSKRGDS